MTASSDSRFVRAALKACNCRRGFMCPFCRRWSSPGKPVMPPESHAAELSGLPACDSTPNRKEHMSKAEDKPVTSKKAKIYPAVARLDDKRRKPTRAQRIEVQRQTAAWKQKSANHGSEGPA